MINAAIVGLGRWGRTLVNSVQEGGTPKGEGIEIRRGVVRNLSRGGIFVEADCALVQSEEVEVSFTLPDSASQSETLSTTAKVVWRSEQNTPAGADRGVGLQFLALNRSNAARIDDFVYERTDTPTPRAIPTREV